MGGLLGAWSRRKCRHCHFNFLPPIADLPVNTQRYCDTDYLLLPVCKVAKPDNAMNKYSGTILMRLEYYSKKKNLRAFAKFQRTTISFVMFVRLYATIRQTMDRSS